MSIEPSSPCNNFNTRIEGEQTNYDNDEDDNNDNDDTTEFKLQKEQDITHNETKYDELDKILENGIGTSLEFQQNKLYYGWTALMEASQNGQTQTVQTLLNKGANIDEKDRHGNTALMEASENGHFETVITLIHHNANVNEINNHGWTTLMYACQGGYIDIVRILLDNGARQSINDKNDHNGSTALMMVCQIEHYEYSDIVTLLLDNGAMHSINEINNDNETALDIARRKNYDTIVQLLVDKSSMTESTIM